MKLLVYDWNSFFKLDLYEVLDELNISYDIINWELDFSGRSIEKDEQFVHDICKNYSFSQYDAIFSINFFPALSMLAETVHIKYIVWSYDSPQITSNPEVAFSNPYTYIFSLDKFETNYFKSIGLDNVFHLPLGVNATRLSKISSNDSKCTSYRTDVSFVGQLYHNSMGKLLSILDEKTSSVLKQISELQRTLSSKNYVLDTLITDGLTSVIKEQIDASPYDMGDVTKSKIEQTIALDVTSHERILLLNLCAGRYSTRLYTNDTHDVLHGVDICPPVHYINEMPYVFAASKINLNPSLLCIRSGVSLRAFDITACGGLLFTNYKEEYSDLFDIDNELVIYHSFADAVEKLDRLMNDDDLRNKIALKGRTRTLTEHTMKNRLTTIFKNANL